jgi:hypothetical protein
VNSKEDWLREVRRSVLFQEDGKESALGVTIRNGVTFLINGKSDGNAVHDAGTQIMSGLLGALLHPGPRHSLVVGLGTGSTAGWLGAIPSMERVDVVELEAAVLKVAELCAPVNRDVLRNPKVQITIGDARETLLTTRQQYDLIVSEPSNPYRAGVASLYTSEYYRAAVNRLRSGGLFLQFVQAYEVDSTTIRTIYATFATAFHYVETWQTNQGDLLFIGSSSPIAKDSGRLRERIAEPPFAGALASAWGVKDVEGVLAYFVADAAFAEELLRAGAPAVNTDDRNVIEFSFGRAVGKPMNSVIPQLREAAHRHGHDRPTVAGTVDWRRVDEQNLSIGLLLDAPPAVYGFLDDAQRKTAAALTAYVNGNIGDAVASWSPPSVDAANITELAAIADMLGWAQDAQATEYIDRLALTNAAEATLLRAMALARRGFFADAAAAFEIAYQEFRKQPWAIVPVFQNSFPIAEYVAAQDPTGAFARQIYSAIEQPFSVYTFEAERRKTLLALGKLIDGVTYSELTRRALTLFEPNVPWDRDFLQTRYDCYNGLGDVRTSTAEVELKRFLRGEPQPLDPAGSAAAQ